MFDLQYKIVDNKYCNIKQLLKEEFHISDRLFKRLSNSNQIFINGIHVNPYFADLNIGDIISVDLNFDEEYDNIVPTPMKLEILYEDDYLLIIDKPAFMPVHPSCNHFSDSLSNAVKFYFDKIGLKRKIRIVNRLDKDTSGIVIFAKNEYIQECFIHQMKSHDFKKEYIAILEKDNILDSPSYIDFNKKPIGTICVPIARKHDSIIERCVDFENGDTAITHYDVLDRKLVDNVFLVHFVLETGRTHQIRVHSAYIGHPIVGDTLYGMSSELINRQALHAYKVSFIHPITKEKLEFEAELPEDMRIFF